MLKCIVVWGQNITRISLLRLVFGRKKRGNLVLRDPWDTGLLARFGITSGFLSTNGVFLAWQRHGGFLIKYLSLLLLAHLYLSVLLLSPLRREHSTTFLVELRLHIQVYEIFSWGKLRLRGVPVES